MTSGPLLNGIRVLDLSDHRGVLTGRLLADLGADVVYVEDQHGSSARRLPPLGPIGSGSDGRIVSFAWEVFGAGRRSVLVDDHETAGMKLRNALMTKADVIILSGRPVELEARSLCPEDLSRDFPHAVVTVITPFGWEGPKRDYLDTDLIMWAAGGPLEPHRAEKDGRPIRPSVDQAYLHAGADAAGGALMGLLARDRIGHGQVVDVSVQSALSQATLARVLSVPVGDPRAHQPQQPLTGLDRSGSGAATSGAFKKWQCQDGIVELHLAMGPSSGRFTNNFFSWVVAEGAYPEELPRWDWPTLPEKIQSGEFTNEDLDAIRAVTRDFLASKTRAEVTRAAIDHRLLCVGINQIEDVAAEEHFQRRELWQDLQGHASVIRLVQAWVHISDGLSPSTPMPAPELGEHTDAVLSDWEVAG